MPLGRFATWSLVATLALGAVALTADALVDSDEEQVAAAGVALIEGRPEDLLAWVDVSRRELVVRDGARAERFADGDVAAPTLLDVLAPFDGAGHEVVQSSVEVRGDRATLTLRLRVERELRDVSLALRRDGQSWLLTEVHVFR